MVLRSPRRSLLTLNFGSSVKRQSRDLLRQFAEYNLMSTWGSCFEAPSPLPLRRDEAGLPTRVAAARPPRNAAADHPSSGFPH
jgi:hypothetical protein